jgi:cell division septation protein DedD
VAEPVVIEPVAPISAPPVVAPPVTSTMEYSVALEAHQNLATAFERLDALSSTHQDLSFHIAPLERGGTLYYHVMAGPVADSTAAAAVRDTLVRRRIKTAALPTDVRYTPLALLIGDYSAQQGAADQVEELRRLDIPSYIVVGVAADSQPLYRVYVGAFAGPAEADVVRRLLRAAGIRDTLVNRSRSSTP